MNSGFLQGLLAGQQFANRLFEPYARKKQQDLLNEKFAEEKKVNEANILNMMRNYALAQQKANMDLKYPGLKINDPMVQLATLRQMMLDRNNGASPKNTIPMQGNDILSKRMTEISPQTNQMSGISNQNGSMISPEQNNNLMGTIESSMQNLQNQASAKEWNSKDKELKTYEMQKAKMMGYTPEEAYNKFSTGATLETLADEKGLQLKDIPEPKNISPEIKKAAQAQTLSYKTLQPIRKIVDDGLAHYSSSTVMGIPMGFYRDKLLNQNYEDQAKYLAAMALAPEAVLKRIKATGANFSVRMLNEITESSYGKLRHLMTRYNVNKAVFKRAEKIIDDTLNESQKEAQKYANE